MSQITWTQFKVDFNKKSFAPQNLQIASTLPQNYTTQTAPMAAYCCITADQNLNATKALYDSLAFGVGTATKVLLDKTALDSWVAKTTRFLQHLTALFNTNGTGPSYVVKWYQSLDLTSLLVYQLRDSALKYLDSVIFSATFPNNNQIKVTLRDLLNLPEIKDNTLAKVALFENAHNIGLAIDVLSTADLQKIGSSELKFFKHCVVNNFTLWHVQLADWYKKG